MMQYSVHKSLSSYIRQQIWPKIIFPAILVFLTLFSLIAIPVSQRNVVSADSLSEIPDLYEQKVRAVSISIDRLYYTGLSYSTGHHDCARIYYTLEDEKCYFVVLTVSSADSPEGILSDVNATVVLKENDETYHKLIQALSSSLSFSSESLVRIACPVILDQYEYTNSFLTFIVYSIHALFLLSLAGTIYIILVLIWPELSVSVRRMHHWGRPSMLYAIAVAEFDTAAPVGRRNLYVTDSFLIAILKDDVIILPLDHITWIYQTHEVHHVHGNAKMQHTLCIVTDRKRIFKLPRLSEPVIAGLINAIAGTRPDILVGNAWNQRNMKN